MQENNKTMKKIILLTIIFFSLISTSNACIPHSTERIIIWTYNWIKKWTHPDLKTIVQYLDVSDLRSPLSKYNKKIWKYYYLHSDDEEIKSSMLMKDYNPWDFIIMVADYNDWAYEEYFAVYELGKLVNINWKLDIVDEIGTLKDWWKNMWQCGNYKDDNAMNKQELLDKLAYYIDVWVLAYSNIGISYYLLGWYFIDKIIQWKWEVYIWVWILLQILVIFIYIWIIIWITNLFRKRRK